MLCICCLGNKIIILADSLLLYTNKNVRVMSTDELSALWHMTMNYPTLL